MTHTFFRIFFYYTACSLTVAASILIVPLANFGCGNDSNKPSTPSVEKKELIGKPATVKPKTIRPKSDLPPPLDEVVVRVIEPGKKPLRNIRYRFRAGKREIAQVTIDEDITVIANGQKRPKHASPPLSFELIASVDSVPKREAAKLKLVFGKFSISNASPQAPTNMVASMLGFIDGVPGIQTVANNGTVESTTMETPDGAKPGMRKLWMGTQKLAQYLIRLPEERIGVGAQWEVIEDVGLATSTRQTTKYELVALNRRGGTVRTEIDQVGRPGLVRDMSNKDIETYLDVFTATGEAQLEFKFGSGVSFGEVKTTTEAVYTSESDTEDNTTEYQTTRTVEIKPATSSKTKKK